jgi:hypothetical protein
MAQQIMPATKTGTDFERFAHSEGGSPFTARELIVVGQGAYARRRPALHQARPVHSLLPNRSAPVDAGPSTSVDEPVAVGEARKMCWGRGGLVPAFAL